MSNQGLATEIYKPTIRKFENWKVQWSFTDNNWSTDLAGMQLIIKFNKELGSLFCNFDIYSKLSWFNFSKGKKDITISNAFQVANQWIYNRSIKSWLQDHDIEMYSTFNEPKPVVAEIFIKNLTNKISEYMTSVSKKYVS